MDPLRRQSTARLPDVPIDGRRAGNSSRRTPGARRPKEARAQGWHNSFGRRVTATGRDAHTTVYGPPRSARSVERRDTGMDGSGACSRLPSPEVPLRPPWPRCRSVAQGSLQYDVTDAEQLDAAFELSETEHGRVEVLMPDAGTPHIHSIFPLGATRAASWRCPQYGRRAGALLATACSSGGSSQGQHRLRLLGGALCRTIPAGRR